MGDGDRSFRPLRGGSLGGLFPFGGFLYGGVSAAGVVGTIGVIGVCCLPLPLSLIITRWSFTDSLVFELRRQSFRLSCLRVDLVRLCSELWRSSEL